MNRLTSREREVAQLVYEGLSNKEIARRLGVSEGTTKIHVHNILSKLKLANRVMLAMFVHEQVSCAPAAPLALLSALASANKGQAALH